MGIYTVDMARVEIENPIAGIAAAALIIAGIVITVRFALKGRKKKGEKKDDE